MTPIPPDFYARRIVALAARLASVQLAAQFCSPAKYYGGGYARLHRGLRLYAFWWSRAIRRHALHDALRSVGSVA